MAQISRSTSSEMVERVGDMMDTEIDDNSTPTSIQVYRWLNEGQMRLSRFLPTEHLGSITRDVTENSVEGVLDVSTFGKSILRFASVKKYYNYCIFYKPGDFERVTTITRYRHNVDSPCYSHSGIAGTTRILFYPTAVGFVELKAILIPTAYSASDDPGDEYRIPVSLEDFVLTYAVMKARQQDEELVQANQMSQEWMQDLQLAFNIPSFSQDTVEAS